MSDGFILYSLRKTQASSRLDGSLPQGAFTELVGMLNSGSIVLLLLLLLCDHRLKESS